MSNAYRFILEQRSNTEVLAAAAATSPMELENCAARLEPQDVAKIGEYVEANCQATGVQRVLIFGGLLELFALSSKEERNPELFEGMCERLGVGRSLGFEFRQVWRTFGKLFHEQPELPQYFVAEALKILARDSTPEAVVQAALQLAKQEKSVDIRTVNDLRDKERRRERELGQVVSEPEDGAARLNGAMRDLIGRAWRYSGEFLRVTLKKNATPKNRKELIAELQLIMDELQQSKKISLGNQDYV